MKYNPEKHHRQSIRLEGYDYSQSGNHFITISTCNRELFFNTNSDLKEIVENEWKDISNRYSHVLVDEFVIMPNHIYGIITVGATLAVARNKRNERAGAQNGRNERAGARPAPTVGDVVGSFKSLCVKKWLQFINMHNLPEIVKIWQHNYYEHIIRNEKELNQIREYIINNPLKWEFDKENPKNWGANT